MRGGGRSGSFQVIMGSRPRHGACHAGCPRATENPVIIRVFLVVCLASSLLPAAVRAQDEAERVRARAEFSRGVERFEASDYSGALSAFEEAYRLAPHPTVRLNIATCLEELGRPGEAMVHYERFLAEAGHVPPA